MATKSNTIVNRIIVTPDKHFPLHDKKAIKVVCKAIERVKPDSYIDLGDTGEWEMFSNHYWRDREKPPLEVLIPMLEKEVKLVNRGMDIIDKSLDKAKCKKRYFIQGNHELWLDEFVNCPYYIDKKQIIVTMEKMALQLMLFAGDVTKYGLARAMSKADEQKNQ